MESTFTDITAECAALRSRMRRQHHVTDARRRYRLVMCLLRALYDRAVRRGCVTWRHILTEEVAEVFAEVGDEAAMRHELVQVLRSSSACLRTWSNRPFRRR
ncbi:hypothetical protein [Actinacidiphila yeochonensis]|uniref:hypothetical protein n=1 Tax=Actinacidiphila yeochonensis TaxID=89050 RepID=UPI0005691D05|nr:hypothetical protein [Actinacidiphila yeochonensis]